jgi:hypothetical protein
MNWLKSKLLCFDPLGINIPFLIAIGAGLVLTFMVCLHDTPYSPLSFDSDKNPKRDDNQRFMTYLANHECSRYTIGGVQYHCDNGWWDERDILKIINGQYPN